jgi:hypothetical protein
MTALLSPLYHWSPRRHRVSILEHGLRTMQPWRSTETNPDGSEVRFPWICCSPSPSSALGLVLDLEAEEDGWDLWQVDLRDGDRIEIRSDFGPRVREVRVLHGLPADRVFWCGWRDTDGPH